ncbi:Predicted transcriptional regulator [Mycobacteroides abscessus subsp. abscessus]|nr:Predicted transcriptional regulator [Mycobacteroides abscessus subsp. abscessus]
MARELRGYKPDPFASAIGISRPYLANIEAGRKKLTNVILARAAQALGVEQIAIMRPVEEIA